MAEAYAVRNTLKLMPQVMHLQRQARPLNQGERIARSEHSLLREHGAVPARSGIDPDVRAPTQRAADLRAHYIPGRRSGVSSGGSESSQDGVCVPARVSAAASLGAVTFM